MRPVVLALAWVLALPAAFGQGRPSPVEVGLVVQEDVPRGRTFLGTVEPVRTSTVGSPVEGRVVEYLVDEGERVSRGDPLVRLRTQELELEIAVAKAELELRRRELEELEHGSRPEEVDQGRAQLASAEAEVAYRRSQLARAQELRAKQATTQQDLDLATQGFKKAEADRDLARATLALVEKGPRAEKLEQARARIRIQEEEIRRHEDRLAEHTVAAPFDGYVVAERTELGQWLSKGAPVVELAFLDAVYVVVPVPEESIRFLSTGGSARVEFAAFPEEVFTGTVESLMPQADPRSRAVRVKIRVENRIEDGAGPRIRIGLSARVTLPAGEVLKALLVPKDALVLGGRQPLVYVVDPDPEIPGQGKARPVPVDLGVAHEGRIQVIGPLEPGERVVVLGNERLRPGQTVVVLEAPPE